MKIKKLEFKKHTEAFVQTQIGDYSISEYQCIYYRAYFNGRPVYNVNHKDTFDSLEEAMDVAQRDFEYRIKQCIEEE